jgi:DNA-binding transcriptional ArsR family regulator
VASVPASRSGARLENIKKLFNYLLTLAVRAGNIRAAIERSNDRKGDMGQGRGDKTAGEAGREGLLRVGKIFKAIADATRRKILDLLREGDLSAGEIAERFPISKPAVSHHLAVLKEAGLAAERREGQQIIYSLREDSMLEAWEGFLAKFCQKKVERREAQRRKRAESRTRKKGDRS